jgi:hypothetical protein
MPRGGPNGIGRGIPIRIDEALAIDAITQSGASLYQLSFDTSGEVGGVALDDEDVLEHDSGVWSMAYDAWSVDADWANADMQALQVPEPTVLPGLATGLGMPVALGRRRREDPTGIGLRSDLSGDPRAMSEWIV